MVLESGILTEKTVRCFPAGTKHLASDCLRETSVGSPPVSFVRYSGVSQKNPKGWRGHTSMEYKAAWNSLPEAV